MDGFLALDFAGAGGSGFHHSVVRWNRVASIEAQPTAELAYAVSGAYLGAFGRTSLSLGCLETGAMSPKTFRDEEINRRRYLRLLHAGMLFLIFSQCVAYAGWWHATGTQRLSLPPQLRYGATLRAGEVHPWEVYVFAGYIHQQLNHWTADGASDNARNIRRLSAFMSPDYQRWLLREHTRHESRFQNRQRYLSAVPGSYSNASVSPVGQDTWRVTLDVRLRDYLEDHLYKDIDVRYFLEVAAFDVNPETNEWGLVLHRQFQTPVRLRSHLSLQE